MIDAPGAEKVAKICRFSGSRSAARPKLACNETQVPQGQTEGKPTRVQTRQMSSGQGPTVPALAHKETIRIYLYNGRPLPGWRNW